MNELHGHIKNLEVSGNLSLMTVSVTKDCQIKAIVIDTPETASYLKEGKSIAVLFKETEVIIGIGNQSQISLQNQIAATILNIEQGRLLSKLLLKTEVGTITSIISTAAVKTLHLTENQNVFAMVKLNEIMLRAL